MIPGEGDRVRDVRLVFGFFDRGGTQVAAVSETAMNSGEPVAAQIRDGRFLPSGSFTRTQPT
jgi:hypothetical protein